LPDSFIVRLSLQLPPNPQKAISLMQMPSDMAFLCHTEVRFHLLFILLSCTLLDNSQLSTVL
jgi:hypothetical protein